MLVECLQVSSDFAFICQKRKGEDDGGTIQLPPPTKGQRGEDVRNVTVS